MTKINRYRVVKLAGFDIWRVEVFRRGGIRFWRKDWYPVKYKDYGDIARPLEFAGISEKKYACEWIENRLRDEHKKLARTLELWNEETPCGS